MSFETVDVTGFFFIGHVEIYKHAMENLNHK